jgi:hypothetical protein
MVHDKVGKPIEVGSLIVYGHALGRCAGLSIGKVLKVDPPKVSQEEYDSIDHAKKYIRWNDRIPKITVIGVDDDWDSHAPQLKKKGVLNYPKRIMVLDRSMVSAVFLDLLDSVVP